MPSDRIQRQIERLLDEAETALEAEQWERVHQLATRVLTLDPDNEDATPLFRVADAELGGSDPADSASRPDVEAGSARLGIADVPASFAGGRYEVREFLGEGGKKRVYLAHDELLDRDVAFAVIKTEGLDEVGRERVA